jgi:hypothetical protein
MGPPGATMGYQQTLMYGRYSQALGDQIIQATGAFRLLKGQCIVDTGGKFATGINNRWCTFTCEYLREFSKKIRGLKEADSRKKPEAKNLVTLSL